MKFIVTEDVEVILNGNKYLLESGDTIQIVKPMFPIEIAKNALNKSGYDPNLPIIGSGENGYAFKDNKYIIKVTSDKGEFESSMMMLKNQSKYIVNIYDADKVNMNIDKMPKWWIEYWGWPAEGWETLNDLYVIKREYLKLPNNAIKNKIDQVINLIEHNSSKNEIIKNFGNIGKQLINMFEDFSKRNINFYDVRSDNIGIKNGTLKLIDTGGVN